MPRCSLADFAGDSFLDLLNFASYSVAPMASTTAEDLSKDGPEQLPLPAAGNAPFCSVLSVLANHVGGANKVTAFPLLISVGAQFLLVEERVETASRLSKSSAQ
jgi:hypothetical protein